MCGEKFGDNNNNNNNNKNNKSQLHGPLLYKLNMIGPQS